MADVLTPQQRSLCMSRIRSKDTSPERIVRGILRELGVRFRSHGKGLPGRPDIVLSSQRTAIFVHGCFWHQHGCTIGQPPKTNLDYWTPKLARNLRRDGEAKLRLRKLGWTVVTIWECQTRKRAIGRLKGRLRRYADVTVREKMPTPSSLRPNERA